MIDFDSLVLGPCQAVFGRPITVAPLVSQPGQPAYGARGIWNSKPVDVPLEDNSILSSQNHTLGIRQADRNPNGTAMFAVPIEQGDQIEIGAYLSLPRIGICLVEDTDDDGQGATELSLKVVGP